MEELDKLTVVLNILGGNPSCACVCVYLASMFLVNILKIGENYVGEIDTMKTEQKTHWAYPPLLDPGYL